MSLVSGVVANLIAGVSQQPPPARAEGTTAHCINAIPSVVTGLRKRPSSRILANLMSYDGVAPAMHIMDGGSLSASRIILGTTTGLRVFKMDGKEEDVVYTATPGQRIAHAASSFTTEAPDYLTGISNPETSLGFTTIADTLYVYNRSAPVRMTSEVALDETTIKTPTDPISTKIPANYTQATLRTFGTLSSYNNERASLIINDQLIATVTPRRTQQGSERDIYYYDSVASMFFGILRTHVDYGNSRIINGVLHIRSDTVKVNSVKVNFSSKRHEITLTPYVVPNTRNAVLKGVGSTVVPSYATVTIKQAAPGTQYVIEVNAKELATFTANAERPESITAIAAALAESVSNGNTGYSAERSGNLIRITAPLGKKVTSIQVTPTAFMSGYGDTVAKFTDLPPREFSWRYVKVAPDPGNEASAYYVLFNPNTGRWQEAVKPGTSTTIDHETMPMRMSWDHNYGVWWVRPEVWGECEVGDTISNRQPSFVNRRIEHLFFVDNRMCLLSDENVIFSEEGSYTNFFRTSVTQLLDSDRIDVAAQAPSSRVAYLRHAVSFSGGIALFADTAQFKIEYPEGLSPKTISIRPLTEFDCSRYVRPQRIGRNVIFSSEKSGEKWSTVREYILESLNGEPDASNLTEALPEYIPAGVRKIAASSTVDHAVVFTAGKRSRLYFYSYYWSGNERLQSAWNYWTIRNTQFLTGDFHGKTLFMLTLRDNVVSLSTVLLEEDLKGDAFGVGVLLDNLVTHSQVTITPSGDNTIIQPPYSPLDGEDVVCVLTADGVDRKGTLFPLLRRGHSAYEAVGVDLRNQKFVVGSRFTFEFEVSPVYARNDKGVPLQDGRFQLRTTSILCNTASAFSVNVQLPGRPVFTTDYSGITLGSNKSRLGYVPGDAGEARVSTPGEPERMTITIRNDTAFPSRFNAIEWTGTWRPRTKRSN